MDSMYRILLLFAFSFPQSEVHCAGLHWRLLKGQKILGQV